MDNPAFTEEGFVTDLELWLNVALLAGLLFGCVGMYLVNSASCWRRECRGRVCYIAALLTLALGCGVAAYFRADTLVPLGLTSCFLVVGMLWDPKPILSEARMSVK